MKFEKECWFAAAERVLLTFWVGGSWAIGYLAVPSLFHNLSDRHQAGDLAAPMFSILAIVSLVCLVLLLLVQWQRQSLKHWRSYALVAALLCVAVSFFVLQPQMQALKAIGLVAGSEQASAFGKLHGVSSVLFLISSVLGLALVAVRGRDHSQSNSSR
jgi:hypothetical protein